MSRIFITGVGVISPLGNTADSNRSALLEGKCGISNLELFHTKYSSDFLFGEIKTPTADLKEKLKIKEPGVTRTTLLALHAFEEAIRDGQWDSNQLSSEDTALIGANTVGGMCLTDELYHDANSTTEGSEYISSYDCASVSIFLQRRFNIGGVVNTINTACSSSANSVLFGARLLKNGWAKRAIVGGVDSLAKFTINGFNSLRILSPEICKPFDHNRKGLNLGEGAAFLLLEREEDIKGKKVYAELSGYCNTNDSFHPSSLSEKGDGPFSAMQGALQFASIAPEKVSFINTHGTGTENNDEVESNAMLRLFNQVPPFTSTKSNIGHTLGAAGAIEAVYSIFNLVHQEVYPHLNFETPIQTIGLKPEQEYRKMRMEHVMSNSFGFGGNCSSLIFSRI